MWTRYKHAYIQNKHIQCVHTCLILLTTAVYAHSGRFIYLSFLPNFICPNLVLIGRNRIFKSTIQFLINRNRNFGWLRGFRFLIGFVHFLSLVAGMCTRYKHACIQNKHIQCIHTCLILLTTAVYEHPSQFICLSFLQYFICLNPVLIDRNRIFKYPSGFLSIGTGILKSHSGFLSTETRIPAKYHYSGS